MMKLTVSAAPRVTRNRPNRRATYLTAGTAESSPPQACCSPGRIQVRHHLTVVRERVGRRLRVRIGLRYPAADVRGVVLVPVDALCGGDERDVVHHDLL